MKDKADGSNAKDRFVSVILRVFNNADILDGFVSELQDVLRGCCDDYELIFVDDGSTDDTPRKMKELMGRHDGVRYFRLSRHFGREISVYAGMQSAIGDYVALMNIETDPPTLVPELIDHAVIHGGIVLGTCERRLEEPALYSLARSLFVWFSVHCLDISLAADATQFMVFSRQALNAFLEIKDRNRHTQVFTAYIGYTQERFPYRQALRGDHVTRRSLAEGLRSGVRILFAASMAPLRAVTWLGVAASLLNLSVALRSHLRSGLLDFESISGDLSIQLGFMFVVVMTVLAVLTEYLTTLLEETRNRPLYYSHEEQTSSVLLADQGRRNIAK